MGVTKNWSQVFSLNILFYNYTDQFVNSFHMMNWKSCFNLICYFCGYNLSLKSVVKICRYIIHKIKLLYKFLQLHWACFKDRRRYLPRYRCARNVTAPVSMCRMWNDFCLEVDLHEARSPALNNGRSNEPVDVMHAVRLWSTLQKRRPDAGKAWFKLCI